MPSSADKFLAFGIFWAVLLATAVGVTISATRAGEISTNTSSTSTSSFSTSTSTSSFSTSTSTSSFSTSTSTSSSTSISGSSFMVRVEDSSTQQLLQDAFVVYSNSFEATGSDGSASVPLNGSSYLIVTAPGYQGYVESVFDPSGGAIYDISLSKLSHPLISPIQHSVGYIGCSESRFSVAGYGNVSDGKLFWPEYGTGGGILVNWANTSPSVPYWSRFDQELATYGQPQAVWIQVCISASSVSETSYQTLVDALQILRSKTPDAKFYISPILLFDPPDMCSITQLTGVPYAYSLVSEAISNGLAQAGPDLGPLTQQLMGGNYCDPSGAISTQLQEQLLLGQQLANFFG